MDFNLYVIYCALGIVVTSLLYALKILNTKGSDISKTRKIYRALPICILLPVIVTVFTYINHQTTLNTLVEARLDKNNQKIQVLKNEIKALESEHDRVDNSPFGQFKAKSITVNINQKNDETRQLQNEIDSISKGQFKVYKNEIVVPRIVPLN